MTYSINPNLTKARGAAVELVLHEYLPLGVVARKSGVHRVTLWRWIRRWRELNPNVQFTNPNRPTVKLGRVFRYERVSWAVPTLSSAPKSHPKRIAKWIVDRILAIRAALGRCAVVIQAELLKERVKVSVSTIKRVVAKYGLQKTKRRKLRRTLSRPDVKKPGDLVEVDTVHYVDQLTGARRYIFTVIDLYSRMAYAQCSTRLLPGNALVTVLEAERRFGFKFGTIQSDNGPEFSKWFKERVESSGKRVHRHTRIHRPNDNAHVERFNRTLREECIGSHMSCKYTTETINQKLEQYIDHYNNERLHLGLQCRTPRSMLQR